MVNANSHSGTLRKRTGTLRYTLTMYTVLFTYVAHYLNNKYNWSYDLPQELVL